MRKNYINIFQVAVVFIGTIVGAGLASGKEITHFFTSFGYKSFLGIILIALSLLLSGIGITVFSKKRVDKSDKMSNNL